MGFTVVAFLVPAIVLTVTITRVFSPDYYKQIINRPAVSLAIEQSIANTELVLVLDQELLQEITDANLDNLLAFLNNQAEELVIYIPRAQIRDRIQDELLESVDQISPQIDSLDMPSVPLEIFGQSDNISVQQSLTELAANATTQAEADRALNLLNQLDLARLIVSSFRVAVAALWIVVGVLLAIFILLAQGSLISRIGSTLLPIALAGAITAMIALATLSALELVGSGLDYVIVLILQEILSGIFIPIAVIGGGMMILAGLGWGAIKLAQTKRN